MELVLFFLIFFGFFLLGEKLLHPRQETFPDSGEAFLICTALGLVTISMATTLLAFAGLIYPITGWIMLGTIYLVSAKRVLRGIKKFLQGWTTLKDQCMRQLTGNWFNVFNLAVLFVLLFLALSLALAPPFSADSLVYHLAIPKAYLEAHGVINLPNNMYSFFPLQFEMLFLFCMTFGWEALPQLAGLGMTLILLGAMTLFFKRRFSTRYLAFVPALFFCVPTFFDISTIAYIDAAVGGFTFLCFYCWERWAQTKQEAWFWLMCLFAASAWGVKLTAFIVLPLVVLGIALAGRHRPDPAWVLKKILIFSGVVLVFILPWWLRNYHYSGNPFAPLFMQVFGGEEKINWDPQRAFLMDRYVRMFGMGRGWLDFLLLPVNLTFFSKINSLKFDGQIGIVYFMLLPCLIWTWKNRNTLINSLFITFGVLLVFWFIYFQYIRFLAISFPFFTLLCVYGLEAMTRPAPDEEHSSALSGSPDRVSAWQKGFLALVAGGVLFNLSLIAKDWNRKAPLDFLAGLESRDQYLTRHLRIYPMYKTMNQKLPQDAKVLFVYMRNFGYLAEREFISDSIYEDHTLKEIMRIDKSVEGMLRQFKIRGITHLMYNNKFVFGKDSAFLPYETAMLKSFIDTHGKLAVNKNEFYLYSFMLD